MDACCHGDDLWTLLTNRHMPYIVTADHISLCDTIILGHVLLGSTVITNPCMATCIHPLSQSCHPPFLSLYYSLESFSFICLITIPPHLSLHVYTLVVVSGVHEHNIYIHVQNLNNPSLHICHDLKGYA